MLKQESVQERSGVPQVGTVRESEVVPVKQRIATGSRLPAVRLTAKQRFLATGAVLVYGLFMLCIFFERIEATALVLSSPFLLCAGLGCYLRYKRAGAVAALAVALMTASTWLIQQGVTEQLENLFTGSLLLNVLLLIVVNAFILLLMLTGIAGAILRQWISVRQSPFKPTVLTVSALDR